METSCLKWAQEKPISSIYSYRELSHVKKKQPDGFYLQNHITRRAQAGHITNSAPTCSHTPQQPWASVLKGSTFTGFSNELL